MIGRRPTHSLPLGFGRFGLRVDSAFCPTWFWVFGLRAETLSAFRVLGALAFGLTAPSALIGFGCLASGPKRSLPSGFGCFGLRVDSAFCPYWFWVFGLQADTPSAVNDWPTKLSSFHLVLVLWPLANSNLYLFWRWVFGHSADTPSAGSCAH